LCRDLRRKEEEGEKGRGGGRERAYFTTGTFHRRLRLIARPSDGVESSNPLAPERRKKRKKGRRGEGREKREAVRQIVKWTTAPMDDVGLRGFRRQASHSTLP